MLGILSIFVPLLTIAVLGWFLWLWFLSPGADCRRWLRLRKLRRIREGRLVRRAAARDFEKD